MRLIDADSLKTDYFVPSTSTGTVSVQYVSLFQILNAPTIEEHKTGRWEKVYGDHIHAGHRPWTVCCSECGMLGGRTKYCPNCGAKMESGDE